MRRSAIVPRRARRWMAVAITCGAGASSLGACSLDTLGEIGPSSGDRLDAAIDRAAHAPDGDDGLEAQRREEGSDAIADVFLGDRVVDAPPSDSGCMADTSTSSHDCGACGHDCLGGACVGGVCQPAVLASSSYTDSPLGLAVFGATLYWTRGKDNAVSACALPGCASQSNVGGCATTTGIAVDATHFFFTCTTGSQIYSCASGAACASGPITSPPYPVGVAADTATVYWVSVSDAKMDGHSGLVLSEPIAGGAVTTLVTNQGGPTGVAVDSDYLYWTEATDGAISRCPLSGCNDGSAAHIVTNQATPGPIVLDAAHLYVTLLGSGGSNGAVVQANLDGSGVVTLASGRSYPAGVVVDATYVYWVESNKSGTLERVPIGGGAITTLATGQDTPIGLAADATALYWGNEGSGTIMRLVK